MKKYLYAGVLTACLAAPAFATPTKFAAQSPDEPLHRRTIVLGVLIVLGLQALRHAPRLPARSTHQQRQ
ncbi:hypothetical protein [Duganella sp. P38]|jgi:hypothetical protein|uniref:hypothetical protein n=1 Tax=Duganella sp. P38 TaxID=3423949 RepID=UPI003D78D884